MSDIDRLDASPVEVALSTGLVVSVERLRTRQFFKLMKILTRGAGAMLMEIRLDASMPQEEFMGKLLGLIILSVPEAENEALEFLRSMTFPSGLGQSRNPTSVEKANNDALWEKFNLTLQNPELDDTVTIFETIVRAEAADIQRLGKRLAAMMKIAEKTGQLTPDTKPSMPPDSPEASPEPMTSSPPNMDGRTIESMTPLSVV